MPLLFDWEIMRERKRERERERERGERENQCGCDINNFCAWSFFISHYPGLLSGSQLMWICDWTKDALLGEASYNLSKHQITKDCEAQDLLESIVTCMANIHSFVLHDCRQTKWAGDTAEEITLTQVRQTNHSKKNSHEYGMYTINFLRLYRMEIIISQQLCPLEKSVCKRLDTAVVQTFFI